MFFHVHDDRACCIHRTAPGGSMNKRQEVVGTRSFQHITPPLRLFCGPESLGKLGRELDRLSSQRAMIFCGEHFMPSSEPLKLVKSAMGERCVGIFGEVLGHSPLESVESAVQQLKELDADAVIAFGGGSAIVTARAASILLAENDHPRNLCTSRDESGKLISPKLLAPKLPQLIIPTTPTTAIVRAGSAIFDPESGQRLALYDPKTRAHSVFIIPELLKATPGAIIVSAGINTFTMAIEGLTSCTGGDPISDALLMHTLRLLAQYLPNPVLAEDLAARSELILAAVLCGQGTDYTGAGMTTVLGHAIGASFKVENGAVNAIVLPHVLRFNTGAADIGLQKVATSLGLSVAKGEALTKMVIDVVEEIFGVLGAPKRLRDVGVPHEALSDIAAQAMSDWFLGGNPRPVRSSSELLQVMEEAW